MTLHKRQRTMLMILLRCLLVYAAVVLLAYLFQSRMIYLPTRMSPDPLRNSARLNGLKLWPQNTQEYLGLVPENPSKAEKGTVVVFHGNAGCALHREYYLPPLERLGFRVILVEYPGYGARGGKPGEKTFVAAGREIVQEALQEFSRPLYLWGESLGCGVACAVASGPEFKIDGIVLLTPFDSLPATAQDHYWFLTARWLVRDRYDNIRNLASYAGPVAVLMAEKDEVIPNRRTRALFENIRSEKRLWTFESAGHNSWMADPDLDWWAEVMDFISRNRPVSDPQNSNAGTGRL